MLVHSIAETAPTEPSQPKIADFMEMMDRELSKTHVAKSFEKLPAATKNTNNSGMASAKVLVIVVCCCDVGVHASCEMKVVAVTAADEFRMLLNNY